MDIDIYPLRFKPVYQDYIWGGTRLANDYGRSTAPEICAESWEIADRAEGMSTVTNGPLQGKTLNELISIAPIEICGRSFKGDKFPLLIKLIDAEKRLSVQVHPNNSNAHICGGEPKTEMWYILDAEPGAQIMAGLEAGTDDVSFRRAIKNKTIQELICSIPVNPGQAIYIPGGRIHAICEGTLILEIQQNSNTTYRVYDWDRADENGKPRELHIEQAMKAIVWDDNDSPTVEPVLLSEENMNSKWSLVESPYFNVQRLELSSRESIQNDGETFHALFIAAGTVTVTGNGTTETCAPGSSILIPAALSEYSIEPQKDSARIILTRTGQND